MTLTPTFHSHQCFLCLVSHQHSQGSFQSFATLLAPLKFILQTYWCFLITDLMKLSTFVPQAFHDTFFKLFDWHKITSWPDLYICSISFAIFCTQPDVKCYYKPPYMKDVFQNILLSHYFPAGRTAMCL